MLRLLVLLLFTYLREVRALTSRLVVACHTVAAEVCPALLLAAAVPLVHCL